MAGIRRLYVMTAAALFVAAASAFFSAQPASANPAFAQAAQQPNCSTCHQPGLEKSAPNAGFTPTGQAIYNAFVTAGTNCSYDIAKAVSSQLPVGGQPVVPCGYANTAPAPQPNQMRPPYPSPQPYPAPSPYQQPQPSPYSQPNPYSQPQPNPYSQPAPYPQQPAAPTYPQSQPYQQQQPQPAYPSGPQPYQPQAYMGPPPWTQSKGGTTQFQQFCILTGKAYFTLRFGGSERNALHFTLSGSNKVSIEAPSGSKWNSNCDDYPGNGSNIWFTTL